MTGFITCMLLSRSLKSSGLYQIVTASTVGATSVNRFLKLVVCQQALTDAPIKTLTIEVIVFFVKNHSPYSFLYVFISFNNEISNAILQNLSNLNGFSITFMDTGVDLRP